MVGAGTALIGVCYGFARFSYGLFAPAFQDEFAMGPALTGIVGSGSYVGYCLAIVVSLVVTARLGARPIALAAGVVATLGTATVAVAPNGVVLAAGILVAGLSTGLASPPMAAAVARWVREAQRDRAQSIVNAGTAVGVVLSGPIVLVFTENWRLAWALFALICAAVTLWVAATVPNTESAAATPTTPEDATRRRASIPPDAARLLSAALLVGLTSAPVWTFGREIISVLGDAGPTASAAMWIVIGISGLVGTASADLINWLGLARSWKLTLLALAAATALLAAAPAVLPLALTAAAMFGASYLMLCGLALLWSTQLFVGRAAIGVGTAFLFLAVGQALGAPIAGALIEEVGHVVGFLVFAALGVLGTAIRPAVRPTPVVAGGCRRSER